MMEKQDQSMNYSQRNMVQDNINNEFIQSQMKKYQKQTILRELNNSQMKFNNINISQIQYQIDSNPNIKEIYENQIPIKIKSFNREPYNQFISLKIQQISSAKGIILHIELTDESNHQFLYQMDIQECDFMILRNEQQLLVDFTTFPNKLIEMLELCINIDNSADDNSVLFQCELDIKNMTEAILKVNEKNRFKLLTHLSLKFNNANDQTIKNYLSNKLNKFKNENEDLRINNQKLHDMYSKSNQSFIQIQQEIKIIYQEKQKEIEQIILSEQRKFNEMIEKNNNNQNKIVREFENDKKQIQDKFHKQIEDLTKKLEDLQENYNLTLQQKMNLESKERELTNKLHLSCKELELIVKNEEQLKIENKNLENVRWQNEKQISELNLKIQAYVNQIEDKELYLQKNNQLLNTTNQQKQFYEENINDNKKQIEKLEKKIQICVDEINKGNEVIEKLQNEIKKKKHNLKQKNNIILKQEELNEKQKDQIDQLNKKQLEIQKELDNKEIQLKQSETQRQDYKDKLLESQNIIESNNQMIQYLNQQLNQKTPINTFNNSNYQVKGNSFIQQQEQVQQPQLNYNAITKYSEYKQLKGVVNTNIQQKYNLDENDNNNLNNYTAINMTPNSQVINNSNDDFSNSQMMNSQQMKTAKYHQISKDSQSAQQFQSKHLQNYKQTLMNNAEEQVLAIKPIKYKQK